MTSITKPILSSTFLPPPPSLHTTAHKPSSLSLQNKKTSSTIRASYEVGGGYTQEELDARDQRRTSRPQDTTTKDETTSWSPAQYEALLKGGEQVTSVLEEMANLVRYYYYYYSFLCLNLLWVCVCLIFFSVWHFIIHLVCMCYSFFITTK